MTISGLIKHIENISNNQLLQEIDGHIQTQIEEYGNDADIYFLSQIQRLKNLADLLDHKRLTYTNLHIIESPMYFGQNVKEEKSDGKAGSERTKPKSPINEVIENFRREKQKIKKGDQYREQSTGDISFAASILPYKPRYIRELCQKGTLPHSKPSGKYIFNRKELEEWLTQNHLGNDNSKFEIGSMGRK